MDHGTSLIFAIEGSELTHLRFLAYPESREDQCDYLASLVGSATYPDLDYLLSVRRHHKMLAIANLRNQLSPQGDGVFRNQTMHNFIGARGRNGPKRGPTLPDHTGQRGWGKLDWAFVPNCTRIFRDSCATCFASGPESLILV